MDVAQDESCASSLTPPDRLRCLGVNDLKPINGGRVASMEVGEKEKVFGCAHARTAQRNLAIPLLKKHFFTAVTQRTQGCFFL